MEWVLRVIGCKTVGKKTSNNKKLGQPAILKSNTFIIGLSTDKHHRKI